MLNAKSMTYKIHLFALVDDAAFILKFVLFWVTRLRNDTRLHGIGG